LYLPTFSFQLSIETESRKYMERKKQSDEYWVNLLIDFLAGKITAEEQTLLFEWVNKSEENKRCYTQLSEIWVSSGMGISNLPFHKERAFAMFKERVDAVMLNKQLKKKKIARRIAGIAAVLIPFVILSYIGYQYVELKSSLANQQSLFTSIVAPKGAQSQVELPDGTQVWLNAGSSLQYANTFGQDDRNLTLTGEAYFDVATNKILPFIVRSEAIKIQVLGTRFNVKAYEQLDDIKVTLIEGSVSLHHIMEKQTYKLMPMEVARYSKREHKMEIVKDTYSQATGWTNGAIVFNGESFEEIVFMLEQRFNVTIHIEKESLKKRQFKGDFKKNETIERIFNVMATGGQFSYKISGDRIDIF